LRSQAHSAEETGPFRAASDVALCCSRRLLRHTPLTVAPAPRLRLGTQAANRRKKRQNSFSVLPLLLTCSADFSASMSIRDNHANPSLPGFLHGSGSQNLNWEGISAPTPGTFFPQASYWLSITRKTGDSSLQAVGRSRCRVQRHLSPSYCAAGGAACSTLPPSIKPASCLRSVS